MGSSLGGFLVGVGVTMLAFSLDALYLVLSVYVQLYDYAVKYKPYLLEARRLLASPEADKLVLAYARIVSEIDPDSLEAYAQEALNIIRYVESVAENPLLGGNLSEYLAELSQFSSMHNSSYSKLEQLRKVLGEVGAWVESSDFNVTLEALASLVSEDGQGAVGVYFEDVERAYTYLQSFRSFYLSVRDSLSEFCAPEPSEVSELLGKLESLSSLGADIQQKKEFLDRLAAFLSSKDFESMVDTYRELRNAFPPAKLQEMLLEAQLALDKAIEAVNVVESFPPSYVIKIIYAAIALEIIISIVGLYLCLRARDRRPAREPDAW